MANAAFAVALALLLMPCASASAADTPDAKALTLLEEAARNKDDDALDRILASAGTSSGLETTRTSDGRGLAWWAWEAQNAYALASILAVGGDIFRASGGSDEDPAASCRQTPGCDPDTLLLLAKTMIPEVRKRRAALARGAKQRRKPPREL
eukprot:TRINITY_DN38691_c0_g1_i1.p2 TRINITY_DN38691_c0_g1~~TRINITY_DN38691_c0_g1_i1.p2  ORF type:complete len:171 (+),score=32.57 TRINITY_DN38691_c0_g1_i1:60-515(+)